MRSLFFFSLVLTACSFQLGSSTQGETGHARFDYGSCLFGCKVDQAMMVGTSEVISVSSSSSSIPAVTVRSTDESVFTVGEATRECCTPNACRALTANIACNSGETATLSIPVVAVGAGSADLVLDQDAQTTFDSVTLSVAQPTSLAMTCGSSTTTDVAIVRGTSCALGWKARDASGNVLMATTGVTMSISDATVADFSSGLLSTHESSITATQGLLGSSLNARSVGGAVITANAPGGVTTQFGVAVTP